MTERARSMWSIEIEISARYDVPRRDPDPKSGEWVLPLLRNVCDPPSRKYTALKPILLPSLSPRFPPPPDIHFLVLRHSLFSFTSCWLMTKDPPFRLYETDDGGSDMLG